MTGVFRECEGGDGSIFSNDNPFKVLYPLYFIVKCKKNCAISVFKINCAPKISILGDVQSDKMRFDEYCSVFAFMRLVKSACVMFIQR